MNSIKVEPKYNSNINPRIGLIALASDFIIEKDFLRILKEDHRQDIGADGFYNCPKTGDEVAIDWFL